MPFQAGFAKVDITPPIGTHKIGWLKDIVSHAVLDSLFARAAVFRTPEQQVAFVQLDTLFAAWPEVVAIRRGIEAEYGFPQKHMMVSATHNHAGPAVADCGDVKQDAAYTQMLISRTVEAFGKALTCMEDAEIGYGSGFEWGVAHNRRVVMRDGTVRTHGTFKDASALCLEGPIDPEVAVIAVRNRAGKPLGAVVNFACHPTHHGGDTAISAGYPGVLVSELQAQGWPVALFLNGASGNIHTSNPREGGAGLSQEDAGKFLAENVLRIVKKMAFRRDAELGVVCSALELPYRRVTEEEIKGESRGAQRFIDSAIYDRHIPALLAEIERRGKAIVEMQILYLDEYAVVGVPGEYFVELGLWIKQEAHPMHALVAGYTNGNLGYIPTQDAFRRGGYETTFGTVSNLAPEAGELIAARAIGLIKQKIRTTPGA